MWWQASRRDEGGDGFGLLRELRDDVSLLKMYSAGEVESPVLWDEWPNTCCGKPRKVEDQVLGDLVPKGNTTTRT